jgi:hypothetical protein
MFNMSLTEVFKGVRNVVLAIALFLAAFLVGLALAELLFSWCEAVGYCTLRRVVTVPVALVPSEGAGSQT